MNRVKKTLFGLCISFLVITNIAQAQSYSPDMMELNGDGGLFFEGHSAFDLNRVGTVEFWVAADWETDPGYDPVMLSSLSKSQPNYVLSILGDRSGISFQSGNFLADLPFNFSDNLIHHVALLNFDTGIMVVIDGKPIGEIAIDLPPQPSTALWIGSAYNDTASFKGAIGGVRFWDIPVERKSLVNYALKDVLSSAETHPDIASLLAISDFSNSTINITDISDETIDDADVTEDALTEETAQ